MTRKELGGRAAVCAGFLALTVTAGLALRGCLPDHFPPPHAGSPASGRGRVLTPWKAAPAAITAHFSPRGGCTAAVVAEINKATREVLVQGYSFTSRPIADALAEAVKRGVKVRVVLDEGQRKAHGSQWPRLRESGCEVVFDAAHQIMHSKVMVIDGSVVLTGSFNWTAQAETSNAENLLVVQDALLAKAYSEVWEVHRGHGKP